MNRGEIYDAELPVGRHPVVVVTRDEAIPVLRNVTVAVVTSTIRNVRTHVPVGPAHGLDHESAINCDDLVTVPKPLLDRYRGVLPASDLARVNTALRIALGLD